jgi:hypothetical protein
MATKEELLERAKELDIPGRSTMDKGELEAAVADAEQDALEEVGEDSEYAEQSDLALDASGPLHFESPAGRVMTGAVNEEHAKAQAALLENKPDDWTGATTEAGFDGNGDPLNDNVAQTTEGDTKDNLSDNDDRELTEVRPEHVIDFPPPVGQRSYDPANLKGDETVNMQPNGAGFGTHTRPVAAANDPTQDARRGYQQKAVFYTDGLSGEAEHNHERAYETPERLQSNDPGTREAGDQSLSEAALEERTNREENMAENVINRDDDPSETSRNAD